MNRRYSPIMEQVDRVVQRIHHILFVRGRTATFVASWLLYIVAFMLTAHWLGVSSNYLVILPVICSALAFGFWGGLIAGTMGLPANLLLLALLGQLQSAPASNFMAELSGMVIGISLGYLSDFFGRLNIEIHRRKSAEDQLRQALSEKETLLKEVHHRVKNNLATIKSLVQLQLGRSELPGVQDAGQNLTRRIMAISLVHEQLYHCQNLSNIDTGEYLAALCRNITDTLPQDKLDLASRVHGLKSNLDLETTVALGLITNELVNNAIKHAVPPQGCQLRVNLDFFQDKEAWTLAISDNGQGMPDLPRAHGMGLLIIRTLAESLDAQLMEPRQGESTWQLSQGCPKPGNHA